MALFRIMCLMCLIWSFICTSVLLVSFPSLLFTLKLTLLLFNFRGRADEILWSCSFYEWVTFVPLPVVLSQSGSIGQAPQ